MRGAVDPRKRSSPARVRGCARRVLAVVRALGGPRRAFGAAAQRIRQQGVGVVVTWAETLLRGDRLPASLDDYAEWVRDYDTLDQKMRHSLTKEIGSWSNLPLVSVIMPVHNPSPWMLREALDSVRAQLYPHWELCVADDRSTDPGVREILEDYSRRDSRIRVRWRETNGGIAEASNTALGMARGSWVALLDHDDLLAESALYALVREVRSAPSARLVYSDEDKINEAGLRFGPYCKPDWNLSLFRSHNLITHLAAFEKTLLHEVSGFRSGFEGAQDYDLCLRCVERLTPEQIRHVPRVLYHWRSHVGSTADESADAKPHAMRNGRKALQEHFDRLAIDARVELIGHGFRVHYARPSPAPLVSLIIPTRDRVHLIKKCVHSILEKTAYPAFEILIVDNGSRDEAALSFLQEAARLEKVRVLRVEGPFNFARLNNAGVRACRGEVIGLLNNDLEAIEPGWLDEMVSYAWQPDVGAVGALLLFPNGSVQHGGVILGTGGWAGHAHKGFPARSPGYAGRLSLASEFSAVTGACLVVRKKLYEEVGGLDEEHLAVACNDVDFCLRLRERGLRNVWTPFAKLLHHESASRGYEDTPEKAARFAAERAVMSERWGDKLLKDPCYSPNLTLDREDFSLARPPRTDWTGARL